MMTLLASGMLEQGHCEMIYNTRDSPHHKELPGARSSSPVLDEGPAPVGLCAGGEGAERTRG